MTPDIYPTGTVVVVKAWWRQDRPTICKVLNWYGHGCAAVRPLEGNPHERHVKPEAILSVVENYPA